MDMDKISIKHQKQVERIVGVARRLFSQKGVNETGLEEIAKICGMRKASLYYYFKSKDEILRHVFEQEWKRNEAMMESLKPTMSLEEIFYTIGSGILKSLDNEENLQFMRILLREGLKNNRAHKAYAKFFIDKRKDPIEKIFTPKLSGKFTKKEIEVYIFIFFGAVMNYAMHKKLMKADLPFEIEEEEYLRLLCRILSSKV
jgi:AcrR family transcriptional regulator